MNKFGYIRWVPPETIEPSPGMRLYHPYMREDPSIPDYIKDLDGSLEYDPRGDYSSPIKRMSYDYTWKVDPELWERKRRKQNSIISRLRRTIRGWFSYE